MEDVYLQKRFNLLYTRKTDLKSFFDSFSNTIKIDIYYKKKDDALKLLLNIEDDEEYRNLKRTMQPTHGKCIKVPKSFVPRRRFFDSWALYEMPSFETTLVTLNNIRRETREEKYRRLRSVKYPGKIILEVEKDPNDPYRIRNLSPYADYLICVRILSVIGGIKKYSPSQELWVPGEMTLERIKDRIICQEDYELANPTVDRPDQSSTKRKMDLNKFGMFYIGDTFYVDKRWGTADEHDYSIEVREWMSARGMNPGTVAEMTSTQLGNLHLRLGYPYLYMHQGKCEHLIVITDARLVKKTDLPYFEEYPLLHSFASIKGRQCVLCLCRQAKLCVTDCDIIPYDNAFVCNLCAFCFLFDKDGQKKSQFKMYKYIDRSAII